MSYVNTDPWQYSTGNSLAPNRLALASGPGTATFIPVGALSLFKTTRQQEYDPCSVAVGVRK